MTTEKIITTALGTKFKKDQVKSIMEIIMNTPNPTVAVEKLLGIYEKPELHKGINPSCSENVWPQEKHKDFVSYDEWKDELTYRYEGTKAKRDSEGNALKDENGETIMIPCEKQGTTSLSRWNSNSW